MELQHLRCFVALAETLHFGKAAQKLEMLPASLSRQIKQLEEDLGARLVARTTRHVSLTEPGELLLESAKSLLAQADRLEAMFRERERETASTLRVGAIDSAAAGLMPQLLNDFRQEHPDIDVQLLEQKTIRLLPRLLSGRLDIAFVRPPEIRDPRLTFSTLFSETPVVAVPESHALAQARLR